MYRATASKHAIGGFTKPLTNEWASHGVQVKGPLAYIQIMTTGGINLETASSYLEAGAQIVGAPK